MLFIIKYLLEALCAVLIFCSIFIFAKVDSSLLVEMVFPIFEDLRLSIRDDTTIDLQYPTRQQSCSFEFPVEQAQTAANVISNVIEDASKLLYTGMLHFWKK